MRREPRADTWKAATPTADGQRAIFDRCRADLNNGIPSLPGGPRLSAEFQAEAWRYAVQRLELHDARIAAKLLQRGYRPPAAALPLLGDALEQATQISDALSAARKKKGGRATISPEHVQMANAAFPLFYLEASRKKARDPRRVAMQRLAEFMGLESRGDFRWIVTPERLARYIKTSKKKTSKT